MGEFKIPHHVSELIKLSGHPEKNKEGVSSESYFVDILEKNRSQCYIPKKSSISLVKKLTDASESPEAVFEKHEDLKVRNFRDVDSLVYLLSEISSDEKVKKMLKRNASSSKVNGHSSLTGDNNCQVNGQSSKDEIYKIQNNYQKQVLSNLRILRKEACKKKNVPPGLYQLPNWVRERPNLTWDFVQEVQADSGNSGPIGILPPNVQESRLIDDILFCLVGVEGDYIHSQKLSHLDSKRNFTIDESSNVSLHQLAQQILSLPSHYSSVIHFVEENLHYEQGLVNHALAAAMRVYLKDYFILVAQLEHQHLLHNLTLQKLWFYLQPTMTTMETIASIATLLNRGNCFGGNVLSVLHEKTASLTGYGKSQEICHSLTRAAVVPYFGILEKWIYKGIISDPYSEFLVEDNELIKKEDMPIEYSDDYWEKRYTVRREQIPLFLEKAANMILRTGKYLNVIRQCGKAINCPDAKPIVYTVRESQYVEWIESAYHFASKKLLDLLMEDADLKGRLKSVKHYFLLDEGDFVVQFMDMAEEELEKDIDDIMPTRLESLLELALRTSVVNDDKYKDDIRVDLLGYNLLSQMFDILRIPPEDQEEYGNAEPVLLTGLEAFAFNYDVKWPLSLVINRKALACYQMLFRHLFYCKHVEGLLGRVWTLNKRAKSFSLSELCALKSAFALRQRMLNFIQNLDYYLTLEVIEPRWDAFYRKISEEVTNVDEVLLCHNDFLDICLTECMLTNAQLLKILGRLMKLCVDFSNFFLSTMKNSIDGYTSIMGDSALLVSICEQPIDKMSDFPAMMENFHRQIATFEKSFDSSIQDLLVGLKNINQKNHTAKLINMLYRLDFNGFYEKCKETSNNHAS